MFFTTSHHIVGEQVCIRSERGFCGISYTACADMVGALYIAEYFAKLGCIETNKLKILSWEPKYTGAQPVWELHGERGRFGRRRRASCQSERQNTLRPHLTFLHARTHVLKVGDACTTDWVAIPCATTSTAGSSKQAVGSTPGLVTACLGTLKPFQLARHLCWPAVWRGVLLGDLLGRGLQLLLALPGLQLHQAVHAQVCSDNSPEPNTGCPQKKGLSEWSLSHGAGAQSAVTGTPLNRTWTGLCLEKKFLVSFLTRIKRFQAMSMGKFGQTAPNFGLDYSASAAFWKSCTFPRETQRTWPFFLSRLHFDSDEAGDGSLEKVHLFKNKCAS